MSGSEIQRIIEKIDEVKKDFKDEILLLRGDNKENRENITDLKMWQNRLIGGWFALTVLVVPITLYVIDLWIKR